MILVADANILFSAILKNGATRELLLFSGHEFYVPEYSISEFIEHLNELSLRLKLNEGELKELMERLIDASGIKIVPFEDFRQCTPEAEAISPDKDDVPYFALALHLGCALWSNDKALKRQNKIKVISTAELLGNKC